MSFLSGFGTLAGRVSDLRELYRNDSYVLDCLKRLVASRSAGPQNKYLEWQVRNIAERKFDLPDAVELVIQFHHSRKRLPKKDLYRYTPAELRRDLEKYRIVRKLRTRGAGNLVVEDNNRYTIILLRHHEAACFFGKGTQWCITQRDAHHFKEYARQNLGAYLVFNKRLSAKNPLYKVAILEPLEPHTPTRFLVSAGGEISLQHETDVTDRTYDAKDRKPDLDLWVASLAPTPYWEELDPDLGSGEDVLLHIVQVIHHHSVRQPPTEEFQAEQVRGQIARAPTGDKLIELLRQNPQVVDAATLRFSQLGYPKLARGTWSNLIRSHDVHLRRFAINTTSDPYALLELSENQNEAELNLKLIALHPHRTAEVSITLLLTPYRNLNDDRTSWRDELMRQFRSGDWPRENLDRDATLRILELQAESTSVYNERPWILLGLLRMDDLDILIHDVFEATWKRITKKHGTLASVSQFDYVIRAMVSSPSVTPDAMLWLAQQYVELSAARAGRELPGVQDWFHSVIGRTLFHKHMPKEGLHVLSQVPELKESATFHLEYGVAGDD